MMDRLGKIIRPHHEQPPPPPAPPTTPQTLAPGDAIILQDGRDFLVQVALEGREELEGRVTEWRWLLLDGGSLLEVMRHGLFLYEKPEILYQGTPPFAALTGEGNEAGLLRDFEARVRANTIAGNPVTYVHGGVSYQLGSTGTFGARSTGSTDAEVWSDISQNVGDNVYFKFQGADGRELLGIWTTHIALFTGAALMPADIKGLYSRE